MNALTRSYARPARRRQRTGSCARTPRCRCRWPSGSAAHCPAVDRAGPGRGAALDRPPARRMPPGCRSRRPAAASTAERPASEGGRLTSAPPPAVRPPVGAGPIASAPPAPGPDGQRATVAGAAERQRGVGRHQPQRRGGQPVTGPGRQGEPELRALARRAPRLQPAAVQPGVLQADRQAEPGAAGLPGPGRIGPPEPVEHQLLLARLEPDTAVADGDRHGRLVDAEGDHAPAGPRRARPRCRPGCAAPARPGAGRPRRSPASSGRSQLDRHADPLGQRRPAGRPPGAPPAPGRSARRPAWRSRRRTG